MIKFIECKNGSRLTPDSVNGSLETTWVVVKVRASIERRDNLVQTLQVEDS